MSTSSAHPEDTGDASTTADASVTADSSPSGDDLSTVTRPDGRHVAVAEYGAPDGEPVLFLHGTPGSRLLGDLFDEAARERGCRVLAPDRPGYGRSDPAPDGDLADLADDLAAVFDDAGVESAPVVGFSGGAAAAFALAGRHPDRVTAVHSVSGVAPPDRRTDQPAVQRLLGTLAERTPRLLSALVRGQAWAADRGSPSVVVSQYTDDQGAAALTEAQAETFRRDFVAAVGRQRAGFVHETRLLGTSWPVDPSAVDVPVQCWHGERDGNVPLADARRVVEAAPTAELTVVDADHATALVDCRDAVLDACLSGTERSGGAGDG